MAALGLLLALSACNLPVGLPGGGETDTADFSELEGLMEDAGLSIEEVMATTPEDQRPGTLELLGAPDSFTLQWQELQGQTVRWEEWSYYDFESRFDFVDGELLWVLDIEPAEDGSIYAHAYNPLEFEAGMSISEAMEILPDIATTEIPLDEADIPGGVVLAGDQILLGFDQDELVYVQTLILSPEEPLDLEEMTGEGPALSTEQAAPATEPAAPAVESRALFDGFDDASQTAIPLFGQEYMEFTVEDGSGVLVSHDPGILVARYLDPELQDFTADVVLWPPDPQPGAGYGFLFRGQAVQGGIPEYYVLLAEPADSKLRLQRWGEGGLTDVAEAPLPDTGSAPFILHVEAAGKTIYAEVNETPVLLAEDSSLIMPGIFGLAIHSHSDGDYVVFQELQVGGDQ